VSVTLVRALGVALVSLMAGAGQLRSQTILVSGSPGLLRVTTAVAGSEPVAVSNATTTYTVVTPTPNRTYKITARLDVAMPVGLTLNATLAAPPAGTSLGAVALDVTDRDVVTGIRRNLTSTRSITYQLVATVAAGVVPLSSRTVTLTIVQEP
jgi:hypothetical protein